MSAGLELRPHHALCGVILVFGAASLSLARLAAGGESRGFSPTIVSELAPPAAYEILDARGLTLARSVERLDLVLSPNAMWQAHTPELMAARIAEATGYALDEFELRQRMLPDTLEEGFVRVSEPRLDAWQAERIEAWARTGLRPDADSKASSMGVPTDGIWVEETRAGLELCWDPLTTLSLEERDRHGFRKYPLPWTRHLADRLAECLWGSEALGSGAEQRALERQRARVWSLLMPVQHHVVLRGLDPRVAPNLYWTLVEEGVAPHQMRVERVAERVHPAGESELLGRWTYPVRKGAGSSNSPNGAEAIVAEAWGLAGPEAIPVRWRDDFERAVRGVLSERRPTFGLEGAAARLLAELDLGAAAPSSFRFRRDKPARQRARTYYFDANSAGAPPLVRTTLDLELCRELGQILEQTLAEHSAALAQAIVIDVQSGDVLAAEARGAYPMWGFAPVAHRFTPGSTFKAVVMAAALEAGLVTPDETFDVGFEALALRDESGRIRRRIREAESSLNGILSASECVAHSSNRGMTQIGLRLEPKRFHALCQQLGYGQRPSIRLGSERAGWLPPLPWQRNYTHASLCFGHELSTTLWQHAEALATIVRGGLWRPLRVFSSVASASDGEGDGFELDLPLQGEVRIFTPRTCAQVRAMMSLGAREGTGRSVASREHFPDWNVGTKTGTAEKVPTEICLHAELTHVADGHACSSSCRRTLLGERPGHDSCYTSSMAIFGQDPATGAELLVLVVIDEPRGEEKYGSRVAGPTAVRILEEAMGRTRHGQVTAALAAPGMRLGQRTSENASSAPWTEGEW